MSHKKKWILFVIIDLVCFALIGFYVCAVAFNFFPDKNEILDPVALRTPAPVVAAPEQTPDGTEEPEDFTEDPDSTIDPNSTPVPATTIVLPQPGELLAGLYPEKFLAEGEEIIDTETLYRSQSISVEVTYAEQGKIKYQVADIYIKNIKNLRSHAVTTNAQKDQTPDFARKVSAVLATNADYYLHAKENKHGWFVRDSLEFARYERIKADLCVIYYDGTMETFDCKQPIDVDAIYAKLPWQIFCFGPELLNADGSAKSSFVAKKPNPRTVIGYYEPGHYALIVVQGTRPVRNADGKTIHSRGPSAGMTLLELSQLCNDLGMKVAYNLDGGGSSTMMFHGNAFGHNSRETSDIVYIGELTE